MKKSIAIFILSFFVSQSYALSCPPATSPHQPDFCSTFKTSAECFCLAKNIPSNICGDMDALYNFMMLRYWSLKSACKHQKEVSTQACIDAWTCYREGGKDSFGKLCSLTGKACR